MSSQVNHSIPFRCFPLKVIEGLSDSRAATIAVKHSRPVPAVTRNADEPVSVTTLPRLESTKKTLIHQSSRYVFDDPSNQGG
jgi:hypothetical protein